MTQEIELRLKIRFDRELAEPTYLDPATEFGAQLEPILSRELLTGRELNLLDDSGHGVSGLPWGWGRACVSAVEVRPA